MDNSPSSSEYEDGTNTAKNNRFDDPGLRRRLVITPFLPYFIDVPLSENEIIE